MAVIIITNSTKWALDLAMDGCEQLGHRLADGNWAIPMKDANLAWLDQIKISGEPIDDTILRMLKIYKRQRSKGVIV